MADDMRLEDRRDRIHHVRLLAQMLVHATREVVVVSQGSTEMYDAADLLKRATRFLAQAEGSLDDAGRELQRARSDQVAARAVNRVY